MQTHNNHRFSIALVALLALTALGACGKEVCESNVGPISEVTVKFKGFGLSRAVTLEIDSTVTGPRALDSDKNYFSRRVSRVAFPESARDGSATFIFDPGSFIMGLWRNSEQAQSFTQKVRLRVYDAGGLLLGEGRYAVSGNTKQCWLNRGMTVSDKHTCADKAEGDACPVRGETLYVCRGPDEDRACEESTCGDGFVDGQNGEACDTGASIDILCSDCLPRFVDRTIRVREGTSTPPQWYEVDSPTGPSPRFLAKGAVHAPSGGAARFVLFGGQDEDLQPLDDTWVFDGAEWAPCAGNTWPTPRFGHAMAYDPGREVLLLFGGTDDATSNPQHAASMNDLWELDLQTCNWRQWIPEGGDLVPEPRYGAAMTYQPGIGTVPPGILLVGGFIGPAPTGTPTPTDPSKKTYLLRYDTTEQRYLWTELASSGSVLPASTANGTGLRHHSLTWVPNQSKLLLIGGQYPETGDSVDRAYFFNEQNNAWAAVAPPLTSPVKISRHQAEVVPGLDDLVIVGGSARPEAASGGDRFAAPRVLREGAWGTLYSSNVPAPRTGHVAFYLPGPDALFTFGGRVELAQATGSPLALANDTWLLHLDPAPENPFLSPAGLKVDFRQKTAPGFYDLGRGAPAEASQDVFGTLLMADLDGDGGDEIALGFPGGISSESVSVNVLVDEPNAADRKVSDTNALQLVQGPEQAAIWPWGSWLGGAMAAGDFTGEGAADLVLGSATRQTLDATAEGAIYVIRGGSSPGSIAPNGTSAKPVKVVGGTSFSIYGESQVTEDPPQLGPPDRFGYALAVGDFDGDGYADIAVGAPGRSESLSAPSSGAVYILSGAGAGSWPTGTGPRAVDRLNPAPLTLRSTTPGLRLGVSLAAGDVDGDGVADLVVGSGTTSGNATCAATTPECGAFAILYGQAGLFGSGGRELSLEALSPSDGALARAGDSDALYGLGGVVTVLDLDADGRGEVVSALGRPDARGGGPFAIVLFRGADLPGALAGSSAAAQATHLVLRAPASGTRSGFGTFLAAGDVNGDRRLDLLVGAPFEGTDPDHLPYSAVFHPVENAGALYVVLGSRLADYWNPLGDGSDELSIDDLIGWSDQSDVTFPVVRVRGGLAHGFLGTSGGTSTHYAASNEDYAYPHSLTLLFEPGWFSPTKEADYRDRNWGRVYSADLQGLLQGLLQ